MGEQTTPLTSVRTFMTFRPGIRSVIGIVCLSVLLAGCSSPHRAQEPQSLTLWSHGGTADEQAALQARVATFRRADPTVRVAVKIIPEGDYGDSVQQAVAAGTLPDVLDVDGPLVASYAYQGALAPLDGLLSSEVRSRMLPSLTAQGTWQGKLWAVGAFDSGLGLYGNKRQLTAAHVRIPTGPDNAWTPAEMTAALKALAARDPDHRVLDLKRDYGTGEWLTYGFSPLLYSAGGGLIDNATGKAAGTLNSPASVRAMTDVRAWSRYVDRDADGKAFTQRRVALSWVGHWTYQDYLKALGKDLVLLPLPNLGNGTKSGQGSWAWAIGAGSRHSRAAAQLLTWLTNDASASAITTVNGAVPGTQTSLASSPLVGPGKPLHLFADQLARTCPPQHITAACVTVPRPQTPAYPTITAAFSSALAAILDGADPATALTAAARTIDTDLAHNDGYRHPAGS
jgi:multiple sugar transport system substrate-binding protein